MKQLLLRPVSDRSAGHGLETGPSQELSIYHKAEDN